MDKDNKRHLLITHYNEKIIDVVYILIDDNLKNFY